MPPTILVNANPYKKRRLDDATAAAECSLEQLERDAGNLEQEISLLKEQMHIKNAELQQLKKRIESAISAQRIIATETAAAETPTTTAVTAETPTNTNTVDATSNVQETAKKPKQKRKTRTTDPSNKPTLLEHASRKYVYNCTVEGCTKQALGGGGGVCWIHGAKHHRKPRVRKTCSQEGCTKKAVKGGVCYSHGGKPPKKICNIEGCMNGSIQGGVCKRHGAKPKVRICEQEECTNQVMKWGVCWKHGAR